MATFRIVNGALLDADFFNTHIFDQFDALQRRLDAAQEAEREAARKPDGTLALAALACGAAASRRRVTRRSFLSLGFRR